MNDSPNVQFNLVNLAQQISTPANGVSYVAGPTLRGPFADPASLINSWAGFVREFGGLDGGDFTLQCKRALDNGARLRVCRVGHYTDITIASTLDAVQAQHQNVTKLTFDADLVTGNVIDLDIDGNAITSVNFNTDNDTTLADLATEIASDSSIISAYVLEEATQRSILVTGLNSTPALTGIAVTGGASQANGSTSTVDKFTDNLGNDIFSFLAKYEGADYNNVVVKLLAPSNTLASQGYFDLEISHVGEPDLTETYTNLQITGTPTVAQSDYLKDIEENSRLVEVKYEDLSALTAQIIPNKSSFRLELGSDGSALTETDYVGDQNAGNGVYSFDDYEDGQQLAIPHLTSETLHASIGNYVIARNDMVYWAKLADSNTKDVNITKRHATNLYNRNVMFVTGGLKILDPTTNAEIQVSELGQLMGIQARSADNFGPWYAFYGLNRGVYQDTLGVVKNYLTKSAQGDANELANNQINLTGVKQNLTVHWGNFSAHPNNDPERFVNVAYLINYLKRALMPTLESFLGDPNDVATWKRIWYTVKPFLDGLQNQRAYFSYRWDGDQNVGSVEDVQVNDPVEVGNGRYKVNFYIKPIASMDYITVNIIITRTDVSFETASEQL